MKVWIEMDVRGAMAAGYEVRHYEPVEVHLAVMPQEERDLLSQHAEQTMYSGHGVPKDDWVLDHVAAHGRTKSLPLSTVATPERVCELLRMIPEVKTQMDQEHEERIAEERARNVKIAAERAEDDARQARERAEALAALAAMSPKELLADATCKDADGYLEYPDRHHRWSCTLGKSSCGKGYPRVYDTCTEAKPYADQIQRMMERENDTLTKRIAKERASWANQHGSPRLVRCIKENIECEAIYRDERLAVERPGWQWECQVPGSDSQPRNPSTGAFALLDRAREVDPEARLVWWTEEHECDESCYADKCPTYNRAEYACLAIYLSKKIVLFADANVKVICRPSDRNE